MGLDIMPDTFEKFVEEIEKSNTIVFNGPMGMFEMISFAIGIATVDFFSKCHGERDNYDYRQGR